MKLGFAPVLLGRRRAIMYHKLYTGSRGKILFAESSRSEAAED
jgi:hypothetical protein